MALTIRKNDTVCVIAGKEKGKTGKVLRVLTDKGRIIVEKVNFIKRHQRPTQRQRQGGIVEREGPIELSNVMLFCTKCDKPTRISVRSLEDKRKVRICKHCGEMIDKG